MKPLIVCFSGRIGSGKTTVSVSVAERLDIARASFGDYIRAIATSKGLDPQSREVLSALGEQTINDLGWQRFCQNVLSSVNWSYDKGLVVDGIRHIQAIEQIKNIIPNLPVYLVHLSLPDEIAEIRQRGKGVEENPKAEMHSTEIQVINDLPSRADTLISADQSINEITDQVIAFLFSTNSY